MPVLFKLALQREVESIKSKYGFPEDKAFLFWFANAILDIDENACLEAVSVEGANDKGVDLFYVDHEDGRVFIVQGKYSPALTYKPKERDVTTLQGCVNWLMDPQSLQREGRPELAQAAQDFLDAKRDGYGVDLIYVYTGPKSRNIEKAINVYNQNPENVQMKRACRHYHVSLLSELWEEIQGERKRIESCTLKIADRYMETKGSFGKALVATVPCKQLVQLYEVHEDRLFDRNVRLFLGARKGSVNAGIAATIRSDDRRGNFWAYNNGITMICDDYEVQGEDQIRVLNFSIVNGCQTTVSLAENGGDAPDLQVLVRCIAASAEIVDDIIRYTNSQNPIRTWDIASQDKTQRRLQNEFQNLQNPYVYLTRRGDRPSGDLCRFREGGKLRQIRVDVLGQYMAAFRGNPVLAYAHKAEIFSRYHDEVFPPDVTVEEALFCCLAGEACKAVVAEMIRDDEDNARILKKGGALFALAVLSEIARLRNGATYLSSMTEERIGSMKGQGRLRKYAKYSAMLYLSAASDEAEIQRSELTTLLRQKEFFDKVVKRATREYDKYALNKDWVKGTLPELR